MQRKKFTILIIVLVIITAVVFGYFYSLKNKEKNSGTESSNFLTKFNPFKKNTEENNENINMVDLSGEILSELEEEAEDSDQELMAVSSFPIAGYGIFMKERFKEVPEIISPIIPIEEIAKNQTEKPTAPPTELVPFVRYVNKATGNVYQTFADRIDERKLTSNVIPRIYEAYFGNKGESVILRYLKTDEKTIETFIGTLPEEVLGGDSLEEGTIEGSFLPENITDLSISPDTLKIFYLFNSGNYSSGITALALGEKKTQVLSSPFTEWLSGWSNNQKIILNTKPASGIPGYLYLIDVNEKNLTKVLGNIKGLTSLISPDGKKVLYGNDSLFLNIYDLETGSIYPVGARTLPEKCVWNNESSYIFCSVPKRIPDNTYPDSWYQGLTSFSDEIWGINPIMGISSLISSLENEQGEQDIDGIKLSVDENENYLFFVNKKDNFLWKLNLK
jgi:hypothetical protein